MQRECDKYLHLNHESCKLNQAESAVATFFESRGLSVERLCARWLSEKGLSPDFRMSRDNQPLFLCEVKLIWSSTAALPEGDWHYNNTEEYRRLIEESEKQKVPLLALPDQIALWKGEIPYPAEGRNTKQKERGYEEKIKQILNKLPVALLPLEVTLHRHDPFIWRDEEIQAFVIDLVEKLELIGSGQIPHDWYCDFGTYSGHYRQPRDHGRFIHNFIRVQKRGDHLVLNSISHLGINWQKIEKDCREAQRQIRFRLYQEHGGQDLARVVVLFIEEDLIYEYLPDLDKLKDQIKRHIQTKSPDLSAVAFCNPIVSDLANLRFIVFHLAQEHTLSLPKSIFDNGVSIQIDL